MLLESPLLISCSSFPLSCYTNFSANRKMAAFSYQQHHPFLLDSAYLPNSPNSTIKMPILPHQVEERSNAPPGFLYYSTVDAITEASAKEAGNLESASSPDSVRVVPSGESLLDHSSSVVAEPQGSEGVTEPQGCMGKKRKSRESSSLSNVQSKDTKGSKSRKEKKPTEDKPKSNEVKERKPTDEPPTGYIHVRARRGQATDSHSLAERVRREKISERMKLLQSLVPGCDKVTGKALMLDEIINYVQSLQNQVEFLSMKLASTNPILYDFALDFEGNMDQPQKMGSMSQDSLSVPSVLQASPIQPTAFEEANKDYPMMDAPSSFLLHGQGPISLSQDHGSFLMQVGEPRQGHLNPVLFNNMCNFQ